MISKHTHTHSYTNHRCIYNLVLLGPGNGNVTCDRRNVEVRSPVSRVGRLILRSPIMKSKPETPLWRNGPQEKPVLCNACGSRWRIRGTLENYIPKRGHASRCRRSRKMRDVIVDLNSDRITTMARTGDARGEGKRGSWRGFGGNTSRASDESEIWTTNGSSSELVMSNPRSLFDVAIKSESDDPDEGITYSGHLSLVGSCVCVCYIVYLYIFCSFSLA